MLYTRKGDDGTTKTFGCDKRISKSSKITEALGTVDEINSLLGICKVSLEEEKIFFKELSLSSIVHGLQEALFIVQAELAGADKKVSEEKVLEVESIINGLEAEMPPIKSFFISGGTRAGATLDFARTVSRRAERRVIEANEEGSAKSDANTLKFMNRLSSILYALARYANYSAGIEETPPSYK